MISNVSGARTYLHTYIHTYLYNIRITGVSYTHERESEKWKGNKIMFFKRNLILNFVQCYSQDAAQSDTHRNVYTKQSALSAIFQLTSKTINVAIGKCDRSIWPHCVHTYLHTYIHSYTHTNICMLYVLVAYARSAWLVALSVEPFG